MTLDRDLVRPSQLESSGCLVDFSTARSKSFVFLSPSRSGAAAFTAALVALVAGCDLSSRYAMAAENTSSFTVVALPDTQYYAAAHPEILEAETGWIVRRRAAERIALVVHEGDIVDADEPRQWQRAAKSLHQLDGVVPYVLTAGNHDYRTVGARIDRDTSMNEYFPEAGFAENAWFRGTYEAGHIENSVEVVDMPGGSWLVLSLEFGPRDAVLAWANAIAKRYASLPAIVVTHAYLYSDDTRYDHVTRPDQMWNPHLYLADTHAGDVNDGEEIWRKLVSKNDNILFVLCGHELGDGVGRLTSRRPDGTAVHQLLANYQTGALGGEGFLRLMQFFPAERRVAIRTYSPYADRSKTDADNDFTLAY